MFKLFVKLIFGVLVISQISEAFPRRTHLEKSTPNPEEDGAIDISKDILEGNYNSENFGDLGSVIGGGLRHIWQNSELIEGENINDGDVDKGGEESDGSEGHDHRRHHQGGSEKSYFPPLPLYNTSQDQIEAFFKIIWNENLTKAELKTELDAWVKNQPQVVRDAYAKLVAALDEMRTNATARIQERLSSANLSSEAKTAAQHIQGILSAQDLTRLQEFEAIRNVLSTSSLEIRREVAKIFGVEGHQEASNDDDDDFGGHEGYDNDGDEQNDGSEGAQRSGSHHNHQENGGRRGNTPDHAQNQNSEHHSGHNPNQAGGLQLFIVPVNGAQNQIQPFHNDLNNPGREPVNFNVLVGQQDGAINPNDQQNGIDDGDNDADQPNDSDIGDQETNGLNLSVQPSETQNENSPYDDQDQDSSGDVDNQK